MLKRSPSKVVEDIPFINSKLSISISEVFKFRTLYLLISSSTLKVISYSSFVIISGSTTITSISGVDFPLICSTCDDEYNPFSMFTTNLLVLKTVSFWSSLQVNLK